MNSEKSFMNKNENQAKQCGSEIVDEKKINKSDTFKQKDSSINKVISRKVENKKIIEKFYAEKFSDQEWEEVKNLELKKSDEHIKIIDLVNDETNKLLKKYGSKEFNIDSKNVHLFDKENYKSVTGKFTRYDSFFYIPKQAVLVNQSKLHPKLQFAHSVFHEFVHFKSNQVAYSLENQKASIDTGIMINSKLKFKPQKEDIYFLNLNEAITEELTIRFQKNILRSHPYFEKENDIINKFIERENVERRKIKEDEISSATEIKTFSPDNKREYIDYKIFTASYKRQRKILNKLIDKLFEKNRNKYSEREEIFELFAKSAFTGNIVGKESWGRLIEETYGSGTLKKIAEKGYNLKELETFIESL